MLMLTRKDGESVQIGRNIKVTVYVTEGGRVRLGIEAPKSVLVLRSELERFEQPKEQADG